MHILSSSLFFIQFQKKKSRRRSWGGSFLRTMTCALCTTQQHLFGGLKKKERDINGVMQMHTRVVDVVGRRRGKKGKTPK